MQYGKINVFFVLFLAAAVSVSFAQQDVSDEQNVSAPMNTSAPLNVSAPLKYALVIGNMDYQRIEKLKNTENDARDIGEALLELGYQVDIKINLDHYQMIDAVDAFAARLKSNKTSEGFFWYAGHAVQIRDENYLLPVDVTIDSESRVRAGSYSLNNLLDILEGAKNKVNVIVLDSCRDNPLPTGTRGSGARGLSVVNDLPPDLFIMFSTAPGNKADDGLPGKRNSPFAQAFLKHIKSTEPIAIMAAHVANETLSLTDQRQRPFYRGSIISDIYYTLNASAPAVSAAPRSSAPRPSAQPDTAPSFSPASSKPKKEKDKSQFNSIGASVGTSFSAPWVTGTVQGTFSPFKYSFFDLGVDIGFVSGYDEAQYYSFFPFAHYCAFFPFFDKSGLYAGAGGGVMFSTFTFPEGKISENYFALDVSGGVLIANMFNVSYIMRTDFRSVNNKIAVGFVKRFL
ncbi:MAG: caspase family protein [Treponema sp.]|jgi:hypothetical protein|nr:caspase family protein [Treponema sp.]